MKNYFAIMDKILKTLHEKENEIDIGSYLSMSLTSDGFGLTRTEFQEAWRKLEKDEYIYREKENSSYKINMKGIMFISSGGYVKERENQKIKSNAATVLWVASTLGGLYYGIQILKHLFLLVFSCHCH